jgi:hypothetical protein
MLGHRLTLNQRKLLADVAMAPREPDNGFETRILNSLETRGLTISYRTHRAQAGYLYHITSAGRAKLLDHFPIGGEGTLMISVVWRIFGPIKRPSRCGAGLFYFG